MTPRLKTEDRVPVEAIRAAFEQSGLTKTDLAHRLGWTQPRRTGGRRVDTARISRALGYAPNVKGNWRQYQKDMSYETAVAFVRALGYDPVDFDL